MKLVTTEQMRSLDRAAIDDYGIPSVVLMENAGRAVAEAAAQMLDGPGRVVVVCGRGNNGGDGFVAARHLSNRSVPVEVYLLAAVDDLQGDAATNCHIAQQMNLPICESPDPAVLEAALSSADLIVDAILGTGISGAVRGPAKAAISAINQSPARVLAVDIPSGISGDTGQVMGVAVQADRTLTFGLPKIGHYCYPGRDHCGEIELVDISLPAALVAAADLPTNLTTSQDVAAMLPPRWADMHKGDAGRLLIVAGSPGMTGAAAMAGLAAVRSGAGLVTVGIPASLNAILEVKCTEVMTLLLPETAHGSLAPEARDEILKFAESCDAVALGPGLSQPHPGELSRLIGQSVADIQQDRVTAARQAAQELQCVVVLKGAGTVIADPSGEVWVNPTGNAGMASGGVGDVLTGVIGGLLAGGGNVMEAAISGVYCHGLAGDLAEEYCGQRALIASDLLVQLPAAFEAVG